MLWLVLGSFWWEGCTCAKVISSSFKGVKGGIFFFFLDKFTKYTSYNVNCRGFNCKQRIKTENMSGFFFFFRRRRSLGGAVDVRGHPVYDKLQRVISPTASCQGSSCNHNVQTTTTTGSSQEQLQHHSVSLGELREFVQALQGGECRTEMMEMHAAKQARPRHRRRFSVDLGEVREFIALTEMRVSPTDESTLLAEQPRVQKGNHNEASCWARNIMRVISYCLQYNRHLLHLHLV